MTTFASPKLAQQQAEKCAEDLIKNLGISAFPIDPVSVATQHDILLQPMAQTEPGIAGFLMKVGDSFGIGYSTRINNEGFKNFTLGHELGHYFLPGHIDYIFQGNQTIHYSKSGFSSTEPHEREADFFSAALLMPKFLFLPALRSAGKGFAAINQLSRKCKTSLTATAIRYAQFAENPIAVIITAGNAIEHCVLSDTLQEVRGVTRLAKGEFLPAGTPTDKFNSDPNNAGTCNTAGAFSSLDDWFPSAPQVEMSEDVVGLGNYGKTLTVLFTNEPLDEEELDEERYRPSWTRK
jgi:hypothetical protein